jgi:transposase-like protein
MTKTPKATPTYQIAMIQRMTDDEYAEARDTADAPICPFCRGSDITVTIPLRWDEYGGKTTGLATEHFRCNSCKRRWTEILRPIAYEYHGA